MTAWYKMQQLKELLFDFTPAISGFIDGLLI